MGSPGQRRYSFGSFELDARSGELHTAAGRVRLQEQSLQTLLLLLERHGDVVTHSELRQRLWPDDTFVDFDHGLHAVVSRLRDVLGDSAEAPRFIETLPRRGYRWMVPVENIPRDVDTRTPEPAALEPTRALVDAPVTSAPPSSGRRRGVWMLAATLALVTSAGIAWSMWRTRTVDLDQPARLAVLPFDNFTGVDDQQFFVDGLHEELTYRLGQMHPGQLAVVGRTSVLRYRGSQKTIADVARELRVDYVLEGSVRRSAPRVRITAQLIRASDESHVWTESYERSWSDLLAIQKDIGARVADSLTLTIVPAHQSQMVRDDDVDPAAHEQLLRGRFLWNQRVRDPGALLTRAIGHFEAALRLRPNYTQALVGLADSYNSLAFTGIVPPREGHARARATVEQALQVDPHQPAAHATLAWTMFLADRDWQGAERAFLRALELDPNDGLSHFRYAHLLAVRGRLAEAAAEARVARQLDPLNAAFAYFQAFVAWWSDDQRRALDLMRESADLEANAGKYGAFAAFVHATRGDCAAARTELARLPAATDTLPASTEAAYALGRCGTDPAAIEALRVNLTSRRMSYPLAVLHLGRRQLDECFEWLNHAVDELDPEVVFAPLEPLFRPIHQDPRFKAILRRLNLDPRVAVGAASN